MSFNLWKFFIEDDVDGFRQYLARATYAYGSSKSATASSAGSAFRIGSPGTLATSPRTPTKPRKSAGNLQPSSVGRGAGTILTRAELNARDSSGKTILHHAASSQSPFAADFVKTLLEIPTVDLYVQDAENGWTALHRALYYGNIDIAQALLHRDTLNATDFSSHSRSQVGGLIKIKDHEGNSPFEVFALTIAPRVISDLAGGPRMDPADTEDNNSVDVREDDAGGDRNSRQMQPKIDLRGDEAFAFGSNKNFSLGLGDEDDRHFPERIYLQRPEHLLWRLLKDYEAQKQEESVVEDLTSSIMDLHKSENLPAVIRCRPIKIQNIVMSKFHTAILTDDPVSNLHICGFGPGGRLGTGDETTRFNYVCIQGGGLASRRVSSIALGQDHSIAICSSGEVFTWGSNKYGQLGYVLPEVTPKEVPTQLTPRQVYGLVKKETIIGAAASSIHSVIFTASGLYTFGKNEGQLGLMDADARSLKIQDIPRRVGVSLVQSPITAVSAIDRATTVLLENHDVIVFTHYGFTRVIFPLEESNIFLSQSLPTRYTKEANTICNITSGGNTIGALSTFGQVFTVDVPKPSESVPSNVSTTNPNKARNALPTPTRVWSIRKSHMSAVDVAMGQDGSIILCTEAGSVWRKEKRANIKSVHAKGAEYNRPKDYKFVRVPHLAQVIAVRSNAFGAFAAIRKDCDVTKEQIFVDPPSLEENLFPLLSFSDYGMPQGVSSTQQTVDSELRFWLPGKKKASPATIKMSILGNESVEQDFVHMAKRFQPLSETRYDAWITSNVTDVRIPVHAVVLKGRSRVLRSALTEFHETYYYSIPDLMSIEYGQEGDVELKFQGADFLTLVNLVFYLYTETLVDVWHYTSKALSLAPRYRQIRVELMRIASQLELRRLERAVRVMVDPSLCMAEDFELAYMDLDFYTDADVVIDLADGAERPAHALLLSSRCPFFEGLFHGRAAGKWLSSRQLVSGDAADLTRVDLKHVDAKIFDLVQRHIYADTGEDLFDNIVSKDLDDFIDVVVEVLSVANELMLDRLIQICQKVIGKYVTPRNVCGLLNTIAECSVGDFKNAALEYICLNMESLLSQRFLEELDQYLLEELEQVVQDNQLAYMPFARSGRAQAVLLERYPDLAEQMERSRQRRMDSMKLSSRLAEPEERLTPRARVGSYEKLGSSPTMTRKSDVVSKSEPSPGPSPAITPNDAGEEMPFSMDEDSTLPLPGSAQGHPLPSPQPLRNIDRPTGVNPSENEDLARRHGAFPIENVETHRSSLDATFQFSESRSPPSDLRISGFELSKSAWKQSGPHKDKTDLREIMEQASMSRVSSLTQAMNSVGPAKVSAQKVSQKERKRQQQQSKIQAESAKETNDSPDTGAGKPQSPWSKVAPTSKTSQLSKAPQSSPPPNPSRAPPRPNMTMRQTVAGTPVVAPKEPPPKPPRSVSSLATTQTTPASPPQIQSIRHAPVAAPSTSFIDARTSMSEILAQQQGEKVAIKEFAARRSLQEIQQEQEFQEWWDLESKRVQDEAARANTASSSRTERTSRSRGGRRRGSGRGGSSTATDDREKKNKHQKSQPVSDGQATRGSGEGRDRESGRVRGKGRPRNE